MPKSLTIKKISAVEYDCLGRLANAAMVPLEFGDQQGALVLSALDDNNQDDCNWIWFNSKLGKFAVDQPELLFRVLSLLPVALPKSLFIRDEVTSESDSNAILNAQFELKNALKYLVQGCGHFFEHLCPIRPFDTQCQLLQLNVIRGDKDATFNLKLPFETLHRWLEIFTPLPRPYRGSLVLSVPMVLGTVSLPYTTMRNLSSGDVLIPDMPMFDTEGNGLLTIGKRQWSLACRQQSHTVQYQLLHYQNVTEGNVMSDIDENDNSLPGMPEDQNLPSEQPEMSDEDYADLYGPQAGQTEDDEMVAAPPTDTFSMDSPMMADESMADEHIMDSPLMDDGQPAYGEMPEELQQENQVAEPPPLNNYADNIPPSPNLEESGLGSIMLELTIRHGHINVPIDNLSQMVPGDILVSDDANPGLAQLFYKERQIAQGELVEINNRLGLKITHVDFD
ncbi:FliM/FliN family flagellar motor switch protein [Veronia pacifica]|uniref:Flagellar motor switch protein FliN-like C-terminal domain-containing protein n=1 Tax=Veronia pacifica TaxID=1080227 RepID=A0A1C3ER13_9GAMM|nr:FliM/FliN family flagellar motor switch protein [Veronia pacifica]ODA35670.1 hypothetical protein A8L45_03385 [Veronia pacifica]